jgi:hypothetical protein
MLLDGGHSRCGTCYAFTNGSLKEDHQATMDGAILVLTIPSGIGLYFLPLIIAKIRRTQHGAGIFWVNLIFGWTILGWIAALIWALVEKRSPKREPRRPLPAESDAWNFHVPQLNEATAIDGSDHWVLGIEDLVESLGNR